MMAEAKSAGKLPTASSFAFPNMDPIYKGAYNIETHSTPFVRQKKLPLNPSHPTFHGHSRSGHHMMPPAGYGNYGPQLVP